MNNKKQIVIIQGGSVFPKYSDYLFFLKNLKVSFERLHQITWKDTLQEKLGENFYVINLKMPHNMNARYEEWKIFFELYVSLFNKETTLIGQSLGGIFLVKYLSENDFPKKISKLILVSAPFSEDDLDNSLGDFTFNKNLNNLQSDKVVIVHSLDDPIIPFNHAEKYNEEIKESKLIKFKDRQHFSKDNFPEIVKIILE
jgi:predicted alpha/beta hydrolase family esterase